MKGKIRCVAEDGRILFLNAEQISDKKWMHNNGLKIEEQSGEDQEAIALSPQAKQDPPADPKINASGPGTQDEANQKMITDIENENKAENDRIEKETNEIEFEKEADKEFPLEITGDDEKEPSEAISGQKAADPKEEIRPKRGQQGRR